MRASFIQASRLRRLLALAFALAVVLALAQALWAQDEEVTIGDWYRIAVQRGGATRSYEGTLVQATDHWLVLSARGQRESRQGVPYLMDLPGAGKWFSHATTEQVNTDCWLPIEAAMIQAHRQAKNPGEPKSLDVKEPTVKRAYTVDMIVKGNVVTVQRDLLKISGDSLLLGPSNASPTARESVKRSDIVSLRFSRVEHASEK